MYDSTSNKFATITPPPISFTEILDFPEHLNLPVAFISIGNKLAVFGHRRKTILFYDVDKNEWTEEPCEVTSHLDGYCCAKIHKL